MLPELLRFEFLSNQTSLTPSETEELAQLETLHNLRNSIVDNDRRARSLTDPVIPEELTQQQKNHIFQQCRKISVRHSEYADAITELYQAYHTIWLKTAIPNAAVRGPAATAE